MTTANNIGGNNNVQNISQNNIGRDITETNGNNEIRNAAHQNNNSIMPTLQLDERTAQQQEQQVPLLSAEEQKNKVSELLRSYNIKCTGNPESGYDLSFSCSNMSNEEIGEILSEFAGINVTKLTLSSCDNLQDLTPLKNLPELTTLILHGCFKLQNFTPLGNLTKLELLELACCKKLQDLTQLGKLIELKSLCLICCYNFKDLTPLGKLTELKSLGLYGCKNWQDLTPLGKLIKLESLTLSLRENFQDFTTLENLPELKSLDLCGYKNLQDRTPLKKLITKLETFRLNDILEFSNKSNMYPARPQETDEQMAESLQLEEYLQAPRDEN